MPRPTSGRLSRRAGGARNVVPPTPRRSACLPSLWQTCLHGLIQPAWCICNGSFCMRSSYATTRTAADAFRQRRSASSSCCTGVELMMKFAPPLDSGKSSNRPKPPPSPPGVLGQQASGRCTSTGKSQPHRRSVPFANLGAAPTQNNNRASGSLSGVLRSLSGTAAAKEAAADAGA